MRRVHIRRMGPRRWAFFSSLLEGSASEVVGVVRQGLASKGWTASVLDELGPVAAVLPDGAVLDLPHHDTGGTLVARNDSNRFG